MPRPPDASRRSRGRPRGERRRAPRPRPDQGQGAPPESTGAGGGERPAIGLLEIFPGGHGRLRQEALERPDDAAVSASLITALGLRPGDLIEGVAEGHALRDVVHVNGHEPQALDGRRSFERLTAVHPNEALTLGPGPKAITGRLLDLIAPVGRGQRGLIVSPPKAGKTTILREIAAGVSADPEIVLIVCLVGERPEEVTEVRRAVKGDVLAADLDEPNTAHARVAYLGVEHAKRLVEEGRNVVVLLDSLTRLARAHNLDARGGRTLSGGVDVTALQPVRQIFGAARAAEEGGSLTLIATCLVDTGSRLDDVVYEEFKGTGNMEVHLDRKLAEQRLFPAVNLMRSGTRHEELLLEPGILQLVTRARRKFARMSSDEALGELLAALRTHGNNARALEDI